MLLRKINNNGFTLIEVLGVIILISIIGGLAINTVGSTVSASREEAYQIMKNNIVSAGYDYINECALGSLQCDFSYDNNKFWAKDLQNAGFFDNLESPIDGKDLSGCLLLEVVKSNGVVVINLQDSCY